MNKRLLVTLTLIVMTFTVFGCGPGYIANVKSQDSGILSSNEIVVFGRLRIIENGREKKIYRSFTDGHAITIRYLGGNYRSQAICDVQKDGTFIWKLPKGKYLVERVRSTEIRGPVDYEPTIYFLVNSDGNAHYLGTLVFRSTIKRSALRIKVKKSGTI